jgi:hypothetical protein
MDLVQQAAVVTDGLLSLSSEVSYTGQPIGFDPARVMLRAHSMGAGNGVLALAVDDQFTGGVLSGSAAMVTLSLLHRTLPQNLGDLLLTELYPVGSEGVLDVFHPAMALLQTALDTGDPLNYSRLVFNEPLAEFDPKSVLMLEGVRADGTGDSYVSSIAIEAHALAMGLPPVLPMVFPIESLAWSPLSPVEVPGTGLAGNVAESRATGALTQWIPPEGTDGHFVATNVPEATEQLAGFLEALAAEGVGRVWAP